MDITQSENMESLLIESTQAVIRPKLVRLQPTLGFDSSSYIYDRPISPK